MIREMRLLPSTHREAKAIKTREHQCRNRGVKETSLSKMAGLRRATQNTVFNAINKKVVAP